MAVPFMSSIQLVVSENNLAPCGRLLFIWCRTEKLVGKNGGRLMEESFSQATPQPVSSESKRRVAGLHRNGSLVELHAR